MAQGKLYLVATPVGNLEDITLRALRTLKEVDLIAAEDTRHTRHLLSHYGISTPLTSYHQYNERQKGRSLIQRILSGSDVALVSDAGTPGISDPAYLLVRQAIEAGIQVVPIPGPTAFISALCASGLPTDRFLFEGFLPHRAGKRRRRLEALKEETATLIFYESPFRIYDLLKEIAEILGERPVVVAREMTKRFEEILRGTAGGLRQDLEGKKLKGEITVLVAGHEKERGSSARADPAG
ncbi:MAG: 16S rRNA (cytidine(1402)-2'-O)-methyltransferase [Candidatus Tectomicrobia bacterium]|uniref:Ribosomal RNA small subunit methyltransferase I n=1 Tax=Tectimicrobiota bacterium TaxID=2528274 RepID=A0A932M1B6_UNCTE|nr:16S rRNA (cytidine(1402)-2'-O)-methyltransferase [Candidatus Tectomicrobia bacterium]